MAKAKRDASDLDAELAALEAELAKLEGKKASPRSKSEPKPPAPPPGAAEPARAPASPPPAAPRPAPAAAPKPDPSLWRRDGDEWVRAVPGEPRVVRRVLDEQGNLVREETVASSALDDVDEVKAERGVGKLFGRLRGGTRGR
jgi:hypothetical protein